MPATPADIATFTTDGVVITSPVDPAVSAAIAADNIDARNGTDQEREMFYDHAADAQWALDETFVYLRKINPIHLGIEVEEAIDIGGGIPIAPQVPTFRCVDETTGMDENARCRAFSHDMGTDRFSVEVLA